MRSGDIGDEAGRSTADAGPLDLDAVRADDDLIEALSAGLVPPPSGMRDTSDIEGELVALLAGWVADVRPETLLHRPPPPAPVFADGTPESPEEVAEEVAPIPAFSFRTASLLEHNELPRPVALASWRSAISRPYVLRAAAALVAVALVSSGVVARSYGAHPGEPLWVITQMAFPAKSHSVEAAISVSTALNTARVALERGRIDEARQAFQTVAAQLADVDPDDGRAELDQQMSYVTAQLAASPATDTAPALPTEVGQRQLATGAVGAVIPSSPVVTPGATAALDAPPTAPSALASGPAEVTSPGSPAADGTSPPPAAVLADPAASDPVSDAPAPVVVNPPPADQASNNPPPVVSDPANDPVAGASTTTEQPAPTTDPPVNQPTTDPPTEPNTPDPVDTGTADHGDPASVADNPSDSTSDGGGSGSSGGGSGADNSAAGQDNAIDTNGAAGSNLGQVTGVVTNTSDSGS